MQINEKNIRRMRQEASAAVMLQFAFDPQTAAHQYNALGYRSPDYGRHDVQMEFGHEAAEAWQAIRDAKARFIAITKEQINATD